jgi:membrane-bound metal-dependent hydrolase YbcI (DUF457 family)
MLWGAHLLFGLGIVSFFTLDPIVLVLAGFLSVMPDLDRPISHRAWFSHSFYAALIFAIVGFVASSFQIFYAIVVFLAVGSHVILDFFTHSGVPLLHPWKKKNFGARAFKSSNTLANRVVMILGFCLLLFNFWQAHGVL